MTDILLLVSAIAILQVGGAYVRYTPFAGIMDDKTKRRLFYTDCLVLLINMSWMPSSQTSSVSTSSHTSAVLPSAGSPSFSRCFSSFPTLKPRRSSS